MRASDISKWIDSNRDETKTYRHPHHPRENSPKGGDDDAAHNVSEHHPKSSHTFPPPELEDHDNNSRSNRRVPKRPAPRNTPTPKKNNLQDCGNNNPSPIPPPHKRCRHDGSSFRLSTEKDVTAANPVAAAAFPCSTCSALLPGEPLEKDHGHTNDTKLDKSVYNRPSPHLDYNTGPASSPLHSPTAEDPNMRLTKATKRRSSVSVSESTTPPSTKRNKTDSGGSDGLGSNNSKQSVLVKRDWMGSRSCPSLSFSVDMKNHLPVPGYVTSVVKMFCANQLATGCVPSDLKKELASSFPAEEFIDINFSSKSGDSKRLLKTVQDVVGESEWLNANNLDEAKWTELIAKLLEYSEKVLSFNQKTRQPTLAYNVTSEFLHDKEYFSTIGLSSKIDYALLLNHTVEPFESLLSKAASNRILLNPFTHPHIAKTIVVLGVEIKSPHGDSLAPAELQVGIWATKTGCTYDMFNGYGKLAAPETDPEPASPKPNVDQLQFEEIKPIIGVTILGPIWNLHVTYRNGKGNYVTLGPYHLGNTTTALGTFMILKFLTIVREYAVKEIWPWVAERLERAVKRIEENTPRGNT